jgi:L-fuconate dehydratase
LINAVWDLYAKVEGKPLWLLLAALSPERIVTTIAFRYIDDALSPSEALQILQSRNENQAGRIAQLRAEGYPAYTTSVGWFGYSDEKIRALCKALSPEAGRTSN